MGTEKEKSVLQGFKSLSVVPPEPNFYGAAPSRAELWDAHPTLMDYRQVFSKETFVIKQGVLYFTRRLNTPGEGGNVLRICLPPPLQQGAWSLCHEHVLAGHRGKDTIKIVALKAHNYKKKL